MTNEEIVDQLREQVAAAEAQLEYDRTRCADAVTAINKALDCRFWLTEGRGSYSWDDDRYREEFRVAAAAILDAIKPLRAMMASFASCPKTSAEIAKARIDMKSKLAAAEEECQRLKTGDISEAYNCGEQKAMALLGAALAQNAELRRALETLNHAAKVAVSTEYGGSFDEETPLVIRLLDGTCDATDELLAETPLPDPRDAALEKADKALEYSRCEFFGMRTREFNDAWLANVAEKAYKKTNEALAAIRAARGRS